MILSSMPSIRAWSFLTNSGSKLPSRSRGTVIGRAPFWPFRRLRLAPLRRFD
jgi:hypothetical protein